MLSQMPIDEIRQIFLSLPVATCMLDRDTKYMAANEKYAALLATPLDSLKGKLMTDFCPPELVANAKRDFLDFDAGNIVADHEILFRDSSLLVSVAPVRDSVDGRVEAITVSLTDISRLKKLEADLAVSNTRLLAAYDEIAILAETDALTGLLNRHGMQKHFESELRRARRSGQAIAVAMLDVDWFKSYNDLYGHVAGDSALKSVAQSIQSVICRPGDWAIRYGGEEFFIILPGADISGAQHVMEKVMHAVESLALSHESSPVGRLTISAGIAAVDRIARDEVIEVVLDRLLRDADAALYEAKRKGRGTTVAAWIG